MSAICFITHKAASPKTTPLASIQVHTNSAGAPYHMPRMFAAKSTTAGRPGLTSIRIRATGDHKMSSRSDVMARGMKRVRGA